jgi:hypothetical protein
MRFKNCNKTEFNGRLGKLEECQENGKWEIRILGTCKSEPQYARAESSKFDVHISAEGVKETGRSARVCEDVGVGEVTASSTNPGVGVKRKSRGREDEERGKLEASINIPKTKSTRSKKTEASFKINGRGKVTETLPAKPSEDEAFQKWVRMERKSHLKKEKKAAEAVDKLKREAEYGKGLRSTHRRQGRRLKYKAEAEEGSEDSEASDDSSDSSRSSSSGEVNSKSRSKLLSKSSSNFNSRREDDDVITGRARSKDRNLPALTVKRFEAKVSKKDELAAYINDTDRKELRREAALSMCEEAPKQLSRQKRSRILNRREKELAKLGATLSPARLLGARSRPGAFSDRSESSGDSSGSDGEDLRSSESEEEEEEEEEVEDADSDDEDFLQDDEDESGGSQGEVKDLPNRSRGKAASTARASNPLSVHLPKKLRVSGTASAAIQSPKTDRPFQELHPAKPSVNNSSAAAPSTDRLAESLCFQLCMILEITPKVARALLGDPESYDEEGNPEMNRALDLFWKTEALNERAYRQEDHEMFQQQSDQQRAESMQRSVAEQRPAPQQAVRGWRFHPNTRNP